MGQFPNDESFPWTEEKYRDRIDTVVFDGNVRAGTSLAKLFYMCQNIKSIQGLANLNTSSVTDMSAMFHGCSSLSSLDLSSLDTSAVEDMMGMFAYCSSLSSLDLSPLDTSSVTNMNAMFGACSSLTSLDLSPLDTSSVTNMMYMFSQCSSLTSLDLSPLDTSSVTNMGGLFCKCSSISSLDLSFLDTSSVKAVYEMFDGCSSLKWLDLSGLSTGNVVSDFDFMRGCNELLQIRIGENFTLQEKFPQSKWINSKGQEFTVDGIPKGVADTYTSLNAIVDIVEPEEAARGFLAGDALTLEVITDPPSLASLLHWSSSDSAVISVDGKGKVTAHNAGTAVISAGLGSLRDSVTITVKSVIEGITLNETSKTAELGSGPFTLQYAVSNEDAADQLDSIVWSSSSLADIDGSDGALTITPKLTGREVITFKDASRGEEGAEAAFELIVTPKKVVTSDDSDTEGCLYIDDLEAIRGIGAARLRVLEITNTVDPNVSLLATTAAGDGSLAPAVYDVALVDENGDVLPWNDTDHPLTVSVKMNDATKNLVRTHEVNTHYVDLNSKKTEERKTWVKGDDLLFEVTHLSTYAITATPRSSSPLDPPSEEKPDDGQGATDRPGGKDESNAGKPAVEKPDDGQDIVGQPAEGKGNNAGKGAEEKPAENQDATLSKAALAQTGDNLGGAVLGAAVLLVFFGLMVLITFALRRKV